MAKAGKKIAIASSAKLPTRYGMFSIVAFKNGTDGKEHVAVVMGRVKGCLGVPVSLHSECLTGDVFSSLRCDCRAQLEASLRKIRRLGHGAVLYLRQEGRGIGLTNKIRAYALQDRGLDTVQANLSLGFPPDMREYSAAAGMIRALGISSVALITNNPGKIAGLSSHGIKVERRIPNESGKNRYNRGYLATKKHKMSHLLRGV